jgi:hypothetical protein
MKLERKREEVSSEVGVGPFLSLKGKVPANAFLHLVLLPYVPTGTMC